MDKYLRKKEKPLLCLKVLKKYELQSYEQKAENIPFVICKLMNEISEYGEAYVSKALSTFFIGESGAIDFLTFQHFLRELGIMPSMEDLHSCKLWLLEKNIITNVFARTNQSTGIELTIDGKKLIDVLEYMTRMEGKGDVMGADDRMLGRVAGREKGTGTQEVKAMGEVYKLLHDNIIRTKLMQFENVLYIYIYIM